MNKPKSGTPCVECGHAEDAHFSCEIGSYCKACDPNVPDTFKWEHVYRSEASSPAAPTDSAHYMQVLSGVCFAHGPYQGQGCPKWPACATDPQKPEYVAQAQLSEPADSAEELAREREIDAIVGKCHRDCCLCNECRMAVAALLRSRMGERWIPVEEKTPRCEELPVLVWRGTTHKIEVGRPMPPFGKGTQDKWRPLPAPPEVEGTRSAKEGQR